MSDQSFLIFSIQGSLFAIDAHVVLEILWLPELTLSKNPLLTLPAFLIFVERLCRYGHYYPFRTHPSEIPPGR